MNHETNISGAFPNANEPVGARRRRKRQRDITEISKRIAQEEQAAAAELGLERPVIGQHKRGIGDGTDGLLLKALIERWNVAPQTAADKLRGAGLPVFGRRHRLVYSWQSIFLAEGVDPLTAKVADRTTHPELFDDLICASEVAEFLEIVSTSTVRRYALEGIISQDAIVTFGAREIRRFRPKLLEPLRLARLRGRLV